jgi:Flp pilus assembly pilin Flp
MSRLTAQRLTLRLLTALTAARRDEEGQATTEYALVLLGAAVVALLVVGWATTGGGAGKIGELFDRVIDNVLDRL